MYRNYFYREDLKVELTQLEEEDEKERFLEGSKHKRLIPGYVALEVKENTCKISGAVSGVSWEGILERCQRTFAGKNL